MFINKIGGGSFNKNNNKTFKGYEYVKNDNGKTVSYFTEPFDGTKRNAYLDFYKVKKSQDQFFRYLLVPEAPVVTVKLDNTTLGASVDRDELFDLEPDEQIAYRVRVDNEPVRSDSGQEIKIKRIVKEGDEEKEYWDQYTLFPDQVTKPMTRNGLSYLTMVDIHKPGAYYLGFDSDKTGEIVYDENLQREKEQIKRNTSNKIGGTLAGIEHDIPALKEKGIKTLFVTPIAGGDDVYYHRYHNKNNFQIADDVGNDENFETFVTSLFKNGMTYVFDGTFTSEGAEGADVQYALRWAHEHPDALYRFRLYGIDDGPVGLGFIPENKENLRFKLVNSPYELVKKDDNVVVAENPEYDSNKPTYVQAYDATMVTDEDVNSKDLIKGYASRVKEADDKLAVNTYQDVISPHKNQIYDMKSFKTTLENAADYINSTKIDINSPEVALLVTKTPTFEFSQKNKNVALWEDKFDLVLRNHGLSGNDEKVIMSKPEGAERNEERRRIERGGFQSIDEDIRVVSYWTGLYRDIIISYIAQTLNGTESVEDIENLIKEGVLPEEIRLSAKAIENIKNEDYILSQKGVLERDEATIKALMDLPLPTLKFAENTVSVLKQGYFFNRASEEDLIGKTRYELDLMGNPQLSDSERVVYERTNKLIKHDIKNFADTVIDNMNPLMKERLIDEDGQYTEFGEYLIEHIGPKIAKYAYLKSLVGDDFIGNYVKSMPDGSIKYNYSAIKDVTSLEYLGIPTDSMLSNASALQRRMQDGMRNLNGADVEFLTKAFAKKYENSTTMSFRLGEAMYGVSSLGMDWRIDALKDVKDIDAVKELSDTFDTFWDGVISYYQKLNSAIAEKHPGSKIIGEITDMNATIKRTWAKADISHFENMRDAGAKYTNDELAVRDFYIDSGLTSEANYSDFFTSLFRTYAMDYEDGVSGGDISNIIKNLQKMIANKGVDYMRNLFTFSGNHDKPRVVHFAALDMKLFHSDFKGDDNLENRMKAMQILFGVDKFSDLPLEIKLNINNLDYFRTVSSQAIAMCDALNFGIENVANINEATIISPEAKAYFEQNKAYFKKALTDLAEGKYLNYGFKAERKTINIDELQDIRKVITSIIEDAQQNHGLVIDDATKNNWIEWVVGYATDENLKRYSVQADRNDTVSNNIDWIFEGKANHEARRDDSCYSAYTASVLAFTKEAFTSACGNNEDHMKAFTGAAINFLNKYDKKYINERSSEFPYYETAQNAERKNGFANSEFEETILMLLEQAEHYAAQDGKTIKYQDEILRAIYTSIHAPAMTKSIAMSAMLTALVGMPAEYGGESSGQTGAEWKNNNVQNQNRNVIQRLKYQMLKTYRDEQEKSYNAARNVRTVEGAEALNIGTPYMLHFKDNIGAWLMQSKDSMTITIVTDKGINKDVHQKTNQKFETVLNDIGFPQGISLAENMKFLCITSKGDEPIICTIAHENGKISLKNETDNGQMKLNETTAPNGVYILKRITREIAEKLKVDYKAKLLAQNTIENAAKVTMRGRSMNHQYQIATPVYNTYNVQAQTIEGQKLSITSK